MASRLLSAEDGDGLRIFMCQSVTAMEFAMFGQAVFCAESP